MADGVDIRAQIDTETVRSLLLVNGGFAGGLATLISPTLENPQLNALALGMVVAITVSGIGLFSATVHNRCRRKCSLEYDRGSTRAQPCKLPRALEFIRSTLKEPCICTRSVVYMWISLACFCLALASVAIGAGYTLSIRYSAPATSACWDLKVIRDDVYVFNVCTGSAHRFQR